TIEYKAIRQLAIPQQSVLAKAWSPDGKYLALFSSNAKQTETDLLIWDVTGNSSPQMIASYPFSDLFAGGLTRFVWNPDASRLATSQYGGVVTLWAVDQ